jgi:hypothetical protein
VDVIPEDALANINDGADPTGLVVPGHKKPGGKVLGFPDPLTFFLFPGSEQCRRQRQHDLVDKGNKIRYQKVQQRKNPKKQE